MDSDYANASKVLPYSLLRQIQHHFSGGLLWIPPRERRLRKTAGNEARDRAMLSAWKAGASMTSLASKHGLSRERVRQILSRKRGN